ncbi:hypothetical protein EEDFHM_03917 [Methylorubrum populi]
MSEIRLILKAPPRREDGPLRLGRVLLDGREGELVYVGREPHLQDADGLAPLPREAYGVALVEALDELAGGIWGDDWSTAVAELSGMNRRSTARDRVRKHGLPPGVLDVVVRIAGRRDAREFAAIVRATARHVDAHRLSAVGILTEVHQVLIELRGRGVDHR